MENPLTEEELKEIREAAKKPIVYDEDSLKMVEMRIVRRILQQIKVERQTGLKAIEIHGEYYISLYKRKWIL